MRIEAEQLENIIKAILVAVGSESAEAEMITEHLVTANLSGHDSHGAGMLPTYLSSIRDGLLNLNTPAKLISDSGSILIFDGQRGFGQRVAREAMEQAIVRCQETGLVLMGLRNAHHIGRVGSYGEQSIAAGLISLHFVNVTDHPPVVAVHNGADARLLTNPICFAMPGTSQTPEILLDMATSKIALGKARVAMNSGNKIADDTLLDASGSPTNDPHVLFNDPPGAIKPLGAYKGFGIAFFCELLAGALTGGGTIQPENPRHGSIINHMLTILIKPEHLVDRAWLHDEIDALSTYLLKSPLAKDADADIMIAGEPERRHRAERSQNGIPIDPNTWQELIDVAATVGVPQQTLDSFCP